jgi:alpha-tubulin suppressor-like RCC1 family protein
MYEVRSVPRFVDVAAGGEHSLFLTDRGAVFVCGRSDNGRLGLALASPLIHQLTRLNTLHCSTDVTVPVELPLPPCMKIAAGEYHSALVHAAGHSSPTSSSHPVRFSTFGSGAVGQLGHGSSVDDVFEPREVDYFSQLINARAGDYAAPVRSAALGDGHTIVVLSDASSHAFGNNESGCLGIATAMTSGFSKHSERYGFGVRGPSRATASAIGPLVQHQIVSVSTCSRHSLFLTANGDVFVAGENAFGQLGLKGLSKSSIPRRIPLDVSVVQSACGARHSLILCHDGTVRVCGSNKTGELGLGRDVQQVDVFTPCPIHHRVALIAAGSAHSLFVSEDRRVVFGCGWGACGLLGTGATEDVWDPNTVVFSTEGTAGDTTGALYVTSASCGSHHSLLLLSDGSVWSAGCNGHGQLGVGGIEAKQLYWKPITAAVGIAQDERIAAVEESVQRQRAAPPPHEGEEFQPRLPSSADVDLPTSPTTPTEVPGQAGQESDKFVCFQRSCLSPAPHE